MLRGELEGGDAPARFESFVNELANTMQPLIRPARELQASRFHTDISSLFRWDEITRSERYYNPDVYNMAEVFTVLEGLLVVGLCRNMDRVRYEVINQGVKARREASRFTVEVNAYVPAAQDFEAVFNAVSTAAEATIPISFRPYYFRNGPFQELQKELTVEELPSGSAEIAIADVLAKRPARALAMAVKSSRGLLAADLKKFVEPGQEPAVVDDLISAGVMTHEVVVVCGITHTQIARVPNKDSIAKLASEGLRCACGKSIDQESVEDLFAITDVGALLLDKSRWLSILVREELLALGVPINDILLECHLGSDEIDCIAVIGGELTMFELKDKEFSMRNAYSFGAKISVVHPTNSIILTTGKIGNDVREHFNRARPDSRSSYRSAHSADQSDSIYYIEGDDFRSGLRSVVCRIYRDNRIAILQRALLTAIPDASSIIGIMENASPFLRSEAKSKGHSGDGESDSA